LKLNTSIGDGLAAAAPLLFGEAAPCFARELLGVTLPSEALLREATVRLELLATLWHREEFQHQSYWRYLNPESSPQLGWGFLVLREDLLVFPKGEFARTEQFVGADFNKYLQSSTGMLSTLGRGRSGLLKKAF
jgi:hypothetical protein